LLQRLKSWIDVQVSLEYILQLRFLEELFDLYRILSIYLTMPSRTVTPPLPVVAGEKIAAVEKVAELSSGNVTGFRLDDRFAALKKDCIKPEHVADVTASYERLKVALKEENNRLAEQKQAAVPEIEWSAVVANGGY
jgi:hypothetical protein